MERPIIKRKRRTPTEYEKELIELGSTLSPLETFRGTDIKILHKCNLCNTENLIYPGNILRGIGCVKCAGNKTKLRCVSNKVDFIQKAIRVHGDLYLYSNIIYINARTHVEIECKIHGNFKQTPDNHLRGNGCPKCGEFRLFYPFLNKPTTLYYIKLLLSNNKVLYKIGITTTSIKERFAADKGIIIEVLRLWEFTNGAEAWRREQELLKEFVTYKYIPKTKILVGGNTELFEADILNLDKEINDSNK